MKKRLKIGLLVSYLVVQVERCVSLVEGMLMTTRQYPSGILKMMKLDAGRDMNRCHIRCLD